MCNSSFREITQHRKIEPGSAGKSNLLHRGKWANADVYQFEHEGEKQIYKGFDNRAFIVKWTLGVFFTYRETKYLRRLADIQGIPGSVQRCSRFAFSCQYLEGETLGWKKRKNERITLDYFIQAEKLLEEMHERRIVHLDLRRGNNWMVCSDGTPAIIDFQSAIDISFLPDSLCKRIFEIDYSGLYKCWEHTCEEPLDSTRRALLERINRNRKLWVFRGYIFQKKSKK